MPYTKPDRKGLPDPSPGEEGSEMRRSDSYLHLSDASGDDTSPPPEVTHAPPNDAPSQPPTVHTHNHRKVEPPELTPPIEVSNENSLSKPSTPRSGSFQRRLSGERITPSRRPSSNMSSNLSPAQPLVDPAQASGNTSRSKGSHSPPIWQVEAATNIGSDTIVTEVTKKLSDVQKQAAKETKMPSIAEGSKSGIPRASPKRRASNGAKEQASIASLSPVPPESPELPTKIPRPKKVKEPVQDSHHDSPGAVDFPVPASSSGSDDYHATSPPRTRKSIRANSSSSPAFGFAKVEQMHMTEPGLTVGLTLSDSEREPDAVGTVNSEKRPETLNVGTATTSPPPPAMVRRDSRVMSGSRTPAPGKLKRMVSYDSRASFRSSQWDPSDGRSRASKQFSSRPYPISRARSTVSQKSAADHMPVRHGDVIQTVCYGPLKFADISEAYNESMMGRTVLDYPLLKRLDEAIFHRSPDENEIRIDGTIRSFIVASETRLLLVIQQFLLASALLPGYKKIFHDDFEPDPLVKFVNDAEALVDYILDDLSTQSNLFSPSVMNLASFVQERALLAQHSPEPSLYFRYEISDVTMKYVQGLCETILGLWPNGKFFIGAEGINPRDSLTPPQFHLPNSYELEIVKSQFDKYFYDEGLLGHVVAEDYRQLLRGAFPFLMSLGQQDEYSSRPDRERDMRLDAWYIERGVFKCERTTFVREHLLIDQHRRLRIYVDDFDGTRYMVYYNHRIGRYFQKKVEILRSRALGLSHLGFELLQSYNLLFLGNQRSRRIARRLGINVSSLEEFDPILVHRQIFDAPRVDGFVLFKERLRLLQQRLAGFRPERWMDFFRGGYAEPIWRGAVWFMMTITMLVTASIIATILVNVLVRG